MKQTVFIPMIASLALVIAVGSATAQADHKPRAMNFEHLDANADGKLTQEEMNAARSARFDLSDTDGDGFLSLAELEAHHVERAKARAEKMLKRMDADADGKISQDEIAQGRKAGRFFDRADADGDGAITKAEFDAAGERMRKHRP